MSNYDSSAIFITVQQLCQDFLMSIFSPTVLKMFDSFGVTVMFLWQFNASKATVEWTNNYESGLLVHIGSIGGTGALEKRQQKTQQSVISTN